MNTAQQTFIKDLHAFYEKSLTWCCEQSESSTSQVSDILYMLLEELERVSTVSSETMEAVLSTKGELEKYRAEEDLQQATRLIAVLKALAEEKDEVADKISPIIETLQFQDRIRQKMENVSKMLYAWMEARAHFQDSFSEEERMAFGNKLLEITTMAEERDIIRKHFPGLPESEEAADDVMLF